MVENLTISISFSEVKETHVGNYLHLSEMSGEFLIIQKPNNTLYFLCPNDCDIVGICQSSDWYIISKDAFNDRLIIGIGLPDRESINGELYHVQGKTTLILWCDILRFTFGNGFMHQFFPYNTHFESKVHIDGALCFYIHDCHPTRCKDISILDRKTSNLVFRFKEGRQTASVAKILSFYIARMPFFKEKAASAVLIPISVAARKRDVARFARFCSLLSHQFKVVDDFRATWIEEDHEQMKKTHEQDKLSNLIFHSDYLKDRDAFLTGDIISSGENFTQMGRKLIQLGARSVTGLLLGKTVRSENQK